MARIFDYIANKGSLYSETGVLGVITGGLLHIKTNKGWMLPCTVSKYITFTLPSLAQKAIITVTKVNNTYTVTQTNTTATITSLVLNNANYLRYIIYDSVASATSDLKNIQAWVNILQPLTYQKRLLSLPKPTELKQSGVIAGYNKIRNGIYNDLSIYGKHGVVTNCLSTIKGLRLHGVNSKVVLGNIGNVKSVSFRIKLKTTTQPILEKAANSGLIHVLGGTLTSLDFANKYVNGVAGTAITANQWHNIVLTSSSNIVFSAATLGLNNTTYGNFEIEDLKFYSTTVSLQEIKAYHNSFNEVILHEKFEDMAVGSSKLPSGGIKNGGSFVCGESTVNDAVIKSIRKGTKYLRCVTAGIVAIPCKQAYGTWEFSWYKGEDSGSSHISFISNSINFNPSIPNGYDLRIQSLETLDLVKTGISYLFRTVVSYITNTTWYRIRITRTTSGTFTIYILGGNFTSWTLVGDTNKDGVMNNQDAQWGSGSNPVTDTTYNSSNYFVMYLDANDRVSDILIQSQIK